MYHRSAAVASRAVELSLREGAFRANDVRRGLDDPPGESTVTRVLRQLEADGWLTRETEGSDIWRAGLQARSLGDLSEAAVEAADAPATQPGEESDGVDPFDGLL
jgi:hypothetical protein